MSKLLNGTAGRRNVCYRSEITLRGTFTQSQYSSPVYAVAFSSILMRYRPSHCGSDLNSSGFYPATVKQAQRGLPALRKPYDKSRNTSLLLSQFLVQLIFVREPCRRYDRSHVERYAGGWLLAPVASAALRYVEMLWRAEGWGGSGRV